MSPLFDRVFRARGIASAQALDLSLSQLLPPGDMLGLAPAAHRIADALQTDQRILVIGDYDADGATSSALVVRALRDMGARDVDFLVPNRFEYGYGLTPEIVEVAAQSLPDLLITVDNGIASIDGVAEASGHGIDVVITDHHLPGERVPAAWAIVNPNQHGCPFPDKALAGVGVAFYVMAAVRSELRDRGWFASQGIAEPPMTDYLDLVAVGTVADLVPLSANNRVLVENGLRRIRSGRCRVGISELINTAGRDAARLISADIGYLVGPRLNAAGRLDDIALGIRCLLEDNAVNAHAIAAELDALNRERRDIESGMQSDALAAIDGLQADGDGELPWGVCLFSEDWHQGVVGLVASRMKERLHRPVVAFAPGEEGEIKGSARSIRGLHLRDALALVDARHPGLMTRFGGHAMAAGLAMPAVALAAFERAFDEAVREMLDEQALQRIWETDGEPGEEAFALDAVEQLRFIAPWGQAFPEPVFDGVFTVLSQRLVADKHLKLRLSPCNQPALAVDAIAFNVDLDRWPAPALERVHCVYRLDVNEYRGIRSLQLVVDALFLEHEVSFS